jgi:hypothetical protein
LEVFHGVAVTKEEVPQQRKNFLDDVTPYPLILYAESKTAALLHPHTAQPLFS